MRQSVPGMLSCKDPLAFTAEQQSGHPTIVIRFCNMGLSYMSCAHLTN